MGPMIFPTISLVTGITITRRMIKGTERRRLITTPKTRLNSGNGRIPPRSVTTRAIPRGIPITYDNKEERNTIYTVSQIPFKSIFMVV